MRHALGFHGVDGSAHCLGHHLTTEEPLAPRVERHSTHIRVRTVRFEIEQLAELEVADSGCSLAVFHPPIVTAKQSEYVDRCPSHT